MILITGSGGFIGRRLVSSFVSDGLEVVPLYRSQQVNIQNERWEADLTRPDHIVMLKGAKQKPDTVIHLAGYVEIVLCPARDFSLAAPLPGREDISRIYMQNIIATANLLDFCLQMGVEHLIFASSQAVYGMPETEIINEDTSCVPLEHYANSKLCCEQLLRVGVRQGIAVTVLRFPGVYSEERQSGVVYEYCRAAIRQHRISVNANMPLPLDVIYIDDVIDGFKRVVQHGGEKWLCLNIATGEPCSLDLLADAVAQLVPGCQVEHSKLPQPIIKLDPTLAYKVLGWKAMSRSERLKLLLDKIQNAP